MSLIFLIVCLFVRYEMVQYCLLFCMYWLIPWQNTIKLQYSLFSISGPVSDDGGKYICTGTNVAGRTNTSAHVTVEYPPVLDQTQVKFWSWDQRPVTLFCKGNIHKGCFFRVVHCQFHLLDCCFHMLNPLISNYQSILHWFHFNYLWSHVGQFLWEKLLNLMFCWHFSKSLCKVCNTSMHSLQTKLDNRSVKHFSTTNLD